MRTKAMKNFCRNLGLAAAFWLLAMSTSAMAQDVPKERGRLKVCKVAGPGVPVGTVFTITADNAPPFTVVAGPGPGGYCTVGPEFPVGSMIPVTETLTNGTQVVSITVAPPRSIITWGSSAIVQIGSGVTELTFTNKRTGYLEICKKKEGSQGGSYSFYLNNGSLGPFTVPAGSCTPAIEVPAGTVIINEVLAPGVQMVACNTLPASMQLSCNTAAGISTVNVRPGDISAQTIAFVTNHGKEGPVGPIEPADPTILLDHP